MTLESGPMRATFIPEMNMLGASLCNGDDEYLTLPGGLGAYPRARTTGLPLLAPWANRLSERAYSCGGERVDLDGLDLYTDPNGLPIHGTMSARERWDVTAASTTGETASLHTSFDYSRRDLLAPFPFPHRMEVAVEIDDRSLRVTTTIRATGDRAVPVSFGYHPYFRLPNGHREAWRLVLPERQHLELDGRGIPTGRSMPAPAEAEPIGTRTFDDLFALTGDANVAITYEDRCLRVECGPGYPYAQVFVPPGADYVCLEPMTAPTDALVSGRCPMVAPGGTFTARFTIHLEPAPP